MSSKIQIIRSPSTDVHHNLALEEFILQNQPPGVVTMLTYVNTDAVVIGKHQNPWKDCPRSCHQSEIKLARRITGGGTVFHDHGNLNYCFILDRNQYDQKQIFNLVLSTLQALGINGELNHRCDLVYQNRKFSGSAFRLTKTKAIHHGTLLIASNHERLHAALASTPDHESLRFECNAVPSTRSPVINLAAINPDLTLAQIRSSLVKTTQAHFGSAEVVDEKSITNTPDFTELKTKHSSWNWIYGQTPTFSLHHHSPKNPFRLTVQAGKIVAFDGQMQTQIQLQQKFNLTNFFPTSFPPKEPHELQPRLRQSA